MLGIRQWECKMDNEIKLEDFVKLLDVSWMSNDQVIGKPLQACNVNYVHVDDGKGNVPLIGTVIVGSTFPTNSGNIWIYPNAGGTNPYDPPWTTIPGPTYPNGIGGSGTSFPPLTTIPLPSIPPASIPPEDKDDKGNRVVKSPSPSLELILVEIAKVLKDKGDILQVREIFERYKLKLVDHDGEVIFDPREIEKLENKGF